jgi:hypothetical protein
VRPDAALAGSAARGLLLHALTLACAYLVLVPLKVGSGLTVALLGTTVSAVLGGLWMGAVAGRRIQTWASCRATMPDVPWSVVARDLGRPATVAAGVWSASLIAMAAASLWSKETPAQVALAHVVVLGPLLAAMGVGIWVEWVVRAPRLTVAYGAVGWLVPMTAFLWAPGVVEHGRAALERAVRVNPASGVLATLGRQNIFWTPELYGALPYADYGVQLGSPVAQAAAWACIGLCLLAGRCALSRVPRRT